MLKERKTSSSTGSPPVEPARRLSLRDPAGNLFEINGRLYRVLPKETWTAFERISSSFCIKKLVQESKLVDFRVLGEKEEKEIFSLLKKTHSSVLPPQGKILEHKKIEFVAYPHEWCSEMLREAGLLTIDISERLLDAGMGLKDATPYNVVFDYEKPVFVDVLSVEERALDNPIWLAYGQFCKTFLNTLLLSKCFRIPFEKTLASHRDGLPSETVFSLLSFWQKLKPSVFFSVTLPVLLSKFHNPFKTGIYKDRRVSPELAKFTLRHLFGGARRQLRRLEKSSSSSLANKYMETDLPYSQEQFVEKTEIVTEILKKTRPQKVLDVGANTGHFSFLAATHGAEVVAIDSDAAAINTLYKEKKKRALKILPVLMDITSPTPAAGWGGEEIRSFMGRAQGNFDAVLMLALIHHLQSTHSIPLEAIASLAHKLTKQWLVIEYISPEDPVFSSLAHGRNYSHVTPVYFEKIFGTLFSVEQKTIQANRHRILYLLKKTTPHAG